jgi:FKBP-type peptidyl-prolyl cis-trans isomerase
MLRLTTRKKVFLASVCVISVALITGGLLWHNQQSKKSQTAAKQTVGDHTISLNQTSSTENSGGLSVRGQADSLGQLNGNSKQSQNSGSNSSGSDIDPSSLAQYDKYRDSQDALFGEIQAGTGAELAIGRKASIYYKVWLTNGALIDQSPVAANGQRQPFGFTLGAHQVILGLEQGVAGMKAGGKRLVIVPPSVGYGSQGQGNIPPNAVLVFEVQLVSVQ